MLLWMAGVLRWTPGAVDSGDRRRSAPTEIQGQLSVGSTGVTKTHADLLVGARAAETRNLRREVAGRLRVQCLGALSYRKLGWRRRFEGGNEEGFGRHRGHSGSEGHKEIDHATYRREHLEERVGSGVVEDHMSYGRRRGGPHTERDMRVSVARRHLAPGGTDGYVDLGLTNDRSVAAVLHAE